MIKLNTTDFSKKAQNLLRFSDGKTMHLIYKGDKLCLQTGTCTAYVGTEDIGEKQAFIPQKAIALINRLNTDHFELAIEDRSVAVKYNRSASNFQMSNNIYEPKIFDGTMPEMNSIDKSLLQQIKRLTRYCSSDSQSRNPTTCGLYFNGNGENLDIVATDGYRLVIFKTKCSSKIKLVVPKKDIEKIVALAISEDTDIKCCEIEKQKALFQVGDYTIITQTLLFERYMDYKRVLNFDTFPVTVNVSELKSAIERVNIVNSNTKMPIIFESDIMTDVKIASSANDTSKGSEYISASYNEEKEFRRGYNGIWFADMLSDYSGDVDLNLGEQPERPLYIKSEGESTLLTLILPMRVESMK